MTSRSIDQILQEGFIDNNEIKEDLVNVDFTNYNFNTKQFNIKNGKIGINTTNLDENYKVTIDGDMNIDGNIKSEEHIIYKNYEIGNKNFEIYEYDSKNKIQIFDKTNYTTLIDKITIYIWGGGGDGNTYSDDKTITYNGNNGDYKFYPNINILEINNIDIIVGKGGNSIDNLGEFGNPGENSQIKFDNNVMYDVSGGNSGSDKKYDYYFTILLYDGGIVKVNIKNNSYDWNIDLSGKIFTKISLYDTEYFYAISNDGNLYKININTGLYNESSLGITPNTSLEGYLDNGEIYFIGDDNYLYKIKNEKIDWKVSLVKSDYTDISSPNVDDINIYIVRSKPTATKTGELIIINKTNKSRVIIDFNEESNVSKVVYDANYLYIGTISGKLFRIDKKTYIYSYVSFIGENIINEVLIKDDYIYVFTINYIRKYTLSQLDFNNSSVSNEIWIYSLGTNNNYFKAKIDEEFLYIINQSKKIEKIYISNDNISNRQKLLFNETTDFNFDINDSFIYFIDNSENKLIWYNIDNNTNITHKFNSITMSSIYNHVNISKKIIDNYEDQSNKPENILSSDILANINNLNASIGGNESKGNDGLIIIKWDNIEKKIAENKLIIFKENVLCKELDIENKNKNEIEYNWDKIINKPSEYYPKNHSHNYTLPDYTEIVMKKIYNDKSYIENDLQKKIIKEDYTLDNKILTDNENIYYISTDTNNIIKKNINTNDETYLYTSINELKLLGLNNYYIYYLENSFIYKIFNNIIEGPLFDHDNSITNIKDSSIYNNKLYVIQNVSLLSDLKVFNLLDENNVGITININNTSTILVSICIIKDKIIIQSRLIYDSFIEIFDINTYEKLNTYLFENETILNIQSISDNVILLVKIYEISSGNSSILFSFLNIDSKKERIIYKDSTITIANNIYDKSIEITKDLKIITTHFNKISIYYNAENDIPKFLKTIHSFNEIDDEIKVYPPVAININNTYGATYINDVNHAFYEIDPKLINYGKGIYKFEMSSDDGVNNIIFNCFDKNYTKDNNGVLTYTYIDTNPLGSKYNSGLYEGDNYLKEDYMGEWLTIELPNYIYINYLKFYSDDEEGFPENYRLYGYNSLEEWDLIYEEVNTKYILNKISSISSNIKYEKKYFKYGIVFNKIKSGSLLKFTQLELYGREVNTDLILDNLANNGRKHLCPLDYYNYAILYIIGKNESYSYIEYESLNNIRFKAIELKLDFELVQNTNGDYKKIVHAMEDGVDNYMFVDCELDNTFTVSFWYKCNQLLTSLYIDSIDATYDNCFALTYYKTKYSWDPNKKTFLRAHKDRSTNHLIIRWYDKSTTQIDNFYIYALQNDLNIQISYDGTDIILSVFRYELGSFILFASKTKTVPNNYNYNLDYKIKRLFLNYYPKNELVLGYSSFHDIKIYNTSITVFDDQIKIINNSSIDLITKESKEFEEGKLVYEFLSSIKVPTKSINSIYSVNILNHSIEKYDFETKEFISSFGNNGGFEDGLDGKFLEPFNFCITNEENYLYVSDNCNNCIRKVNVETGYITTVAGNTKIDLKDGNEFEGSIGRPYGIWIDNDDKYIYIADRCNKKIRRLFSGYNYYKEAINIKNIITKDETINNLYIDDTNKYLYFNKFNSIIKYNLRENIESTIYLLQNVYDFYNENDNIYYTIKNDSYSNIDLKSYEYFSLENIIESDEIYSYETLGYDNSMFLWFLFDNNLNDVTGKEVTINDGVYISNSDHFINCAVFEDNIFKLSGSYYIGISKEITISFWIKLTNNTNVQCGILDIFNSNNIGDYYISIYLNTSSDKLRFTVKNNTINEDYEEINLDSNYENKWIFITWVMTNEGNWYILINNNKNIYNSKEYPTNLLIDTIYICNKVIENGSTNGKIADLRIYERSLSRKEIMKLYNRNDMLLWLKFDSDFNDYSGNNNKFIERSGVYIDKSDFFLNCVKFEETNSYLNYNDIYIGDFNEYTFSIWVNFGNTNENESVIYLGDGKSFSNNNISIRRDGTSTSLEFNILNKNDSNFTRIENAIIIDKWIHIVFIIEKGNNWKIYIDNILHTTLITTFPDNIFRAKTYIGRSNYWPQSGFDDFKGQMADLRIYRRKLDEKEISNLYNVHVKEKEIKDSKSSTNYNLIGHYFISEDIQNQSIYGNSTDLILFEGTHISREIKYTTDSKIGTHSFEFNKNTSFQHNNRNNYIGKNGTTIALWYKIIEDNDRFNNFFEIKNRIGENGFKNYKNIQTSGTIDINIGFKVYKQGNNNFTYRSSKNYYGISSSYEETILDSDMNVTSVNEWTHVCIVFSGLDTKIYNNGIELLTEKTGTYINQINFNNLYNDKDGTRIWIGGIGSPFENAEFGGLMNDLRFYTTALNSEEIYDIYLNSFKERYIDGLYFHLILDYSFEENILNQSKYENNEFEYNFNNNGLFFNSDEVIYNNIYIYDNLLITFWLYINNLDNDFNIFEFNREEYDENYNFITNMKLQLKYDSFNGYLNLISNKETDDNKTIEINGTISTNKWYRVTIVGFVNNTEIYLNKEKVHQDVYVLTKNTLYDSVKLGGTNFTGYIDDFRIYNKVFTELERHKFYKPVEYPIINNTNFLIWFKFNNSFEDSSGNYSELDQLNTNYSFVKDEDIYGEYCIEVGNGSIENYLSLSNGETFNLPNKFTISFWFKNVSITNWARIINIKQSGNTANFQEDPLYIFHYHDYPSGNNDISGFPFIQNYFSNKKWIHMCYVYSNDNTNQIYKSYVNSKYNSDLGNVSLILESLQIYIGGIGITRFYDFRIYNRSLSEKEIQNLYNMNENNYKICNEIDNSLEYYRLEYPILQDYNDLISWFKFDEDLNDSSDNTNIFITTGSSYDLDDKKTGISSVNITTSISTTIELSKSWSLCYWFKITNIADNIYLFKLSDYTSDNIYISFKKNTGTSIICDRFNNQLTFIDDTWYHLTILFEDYSFYLYINGINITYNTNIGDDDKQTIGNIYENVNENVVKLELNGSQKVDDLRVYNRVLSEIEIDYLSKDTFLRKDNFLTPYNYLFHKNTKTFINYEKQNLLPYNMSINYWKKINEIGFLYNVLSIYNNENKIITTNEYFTSDTILLIKLEIGTHIYEEEISYDLNKWYNITYIVKPENVKVYFNNIEIIDENHNLSINYNYTNLYINGKGENNIESSYELDNFKIYNKELIDIEIKSIIYNNILYKNNDELFVLKNIDKIEYYNNEILIKDKKNIIEYDEIYKSKKVLNFDNISNDIIDFKRINEYYYIITDDTLYKYNKYNDTLLNYYIGNNLRKISISPNENHIYLLKGDDIIKYENDSYEIIHNEPFINNINLSKDGNKLYYIVNDSNINIIENLDNQYISKIKGISTENYKYGVNNYTHNIYIQDNTNILPKDNHYEYTLKLKKTDNMKTYIYGYDINNILITKPIEILSKTEWDIVNEIEEINKNFLSILTDKKSEDLSEIKEDLSKIKFTIELNSEIDYDIETINNFDYKKPKIEIYNLNFKYYNTSTFTTNQLYDSISFTGSHIVRCNEKIINKGYIVYSTGKYMDINSTYNADNYVDNIKIVQALPIVEYSKKAKDKKCFGIINKEEEIFKKVRDDGYNTFMILKKSGDNRIIVNSIGEGAIWISNYNGPLENGDFITSSPIPGIGMKQDEDYITNYTVGKITMDCDFNPKIINIKKSVKTIKNGKLDNYLDEEGNIIYQDTGKKEEEYEIKYIKLNGDVIEEGEYNSNIDYKMAYVGCVYHCG